MTWAQIKDPVSYMFLAGTVVASWSLTQGVAGFDPFTVMTNIKGKLTWLLLAGEKGLTISSIV